MDASQGKTFEYFSKTYVVWDFGENHLVEKRDYYSHDNFVANNMSDAGYQRMVIAFNRLFKKIELTSTFDETKER